jgi:hypothetical protein
VGSGKIVEPLPLEEFRVEELGVVDNFAGRTSDPPPPWLPEWAYVDRSDEL